MSNQPFTFPPPPPPPPKRSADNNPVQSYGYGRGTYRGGGNSHRGQHRGGRGGNFPSQHHHDRMTNSYAHNGEQTSRRPYNNHPPQRNSYMNAGQKRDHTAAFTQPSNPRSRPTAPPAVPSFNASIAHLLPGNPATATSIAKSPSKPVQPKKNLLGLTPAHPDDSSSEEDEDEELRLFNSFSASSGTTAPGLSFTYNGQLSSLRTPAEIQAWILERKKRFPTVAKAEAAKKEREEKKRKWEEEKAEKRRKLDQERAERKQKLEAEKEARTLARHMAAVEKEARKQAPSQTDEKQVNSSTADSPEARAVARAEKLRKKALKAQEALAKAEEALRIAKEARARSLADPAAVAGGVNSVVETVSEAIPPPQAAVDPDETSSSGSSGSDDDFSDSESDHASDSDGSSGAPETLSTKDPSLHDNKGAPPFQAAKPLRQSRPCQNYFRYGRCRFGSGCRYSHDRKSHALKDTEIARPGAKSQKDRMQKGVSLGASTGPMRRKGLFQVMVEKEEEEARRKVAAAILQLGESGALDEPASIT